MVKFGVVSAISALALLWGIGSAAGAAHASTDIGTKRAGVVHTINNPTIAAPSPFFVTRGPKDYQSGGSNSLSALPRTADAKNFNSSRSNRGSIVAPDGGDDEAGEYEQEGKTSHDKGRAGGRNPQTGKEIKIPQEDDEQ